MGSQRFASVRFFYQLFRTHPNSILFPHFPSCIRHNLHNLHNLHFVFHISHLELLQQYEQTSRQTRLKNTIKEGITQNQSRRSNNSCCNRSYSKNQIQAQEWVLPRLACTWHKCGLAINYRLGGDKNVLSRNHHKCGDRPPSHFDCRTSHTFQEQWGACICGISSSTRFSPCSDCTPLDNKFTTNMRYSKLALPRSEPSSSSSCCVYMQMCSDEPGLDFAHLLFEYSWLVMEKNASF